LRGSQTLPDDDPSPDEKIMAGMPQKMMGAPPFFQKGR
jgi:hypothetical protein